MIDVIPPINLPQEFCNILKTDIQKNGLNRLHNTMAKAPHLQAIFSKIYREELKTTSINSILKNQGFETVRDKLASAFVFHKERGFYPASEQRQLCDDILVLHKKLDSFSVEGFNRSFLLGMYFKIAQLKKMDEDLDYIDDMFSLHDDIFEVLKLLKVKCVKIDWITLMCHLFCQYLGSKKVIDFIKAGVHYKGIYEELSFEQKEIFVKNMINYGYSINEADFIIEQRI